MNERKLELKFLSERKFNAIANKNLGLTNLHIQVTSHS